MRILKRPRVLIAFPLALLAALVLFVPFAFAGGDGAPPPADGWSMGDVMALVALIIASVGAVVDAIRGVLAFVAPRTASKVDDRALAEFNKLHDRLNGIEARLPPAAKTVSLSLLALVLLGLGGAALPACTKADAIADVKAAGHAIVNCTGMALGTTPGLNIPTLTAIANMVQAERVSCTPAGGSFDWGCAERDAIHEGEVIGGCALAQLVAGAPPPTGTSVQALAGAPPPGRAEMEDFRARIAAGATFHTTQGDI